MNRTNYSQKREAIYETIASTKTHPDAEWIYQKVKEIYPTISLGTVYRNLVQLRNDGKIKSVGVVKGCERFDANVGPHSHFICKKCGRIIDIGGLFSIHTSRLDEIVRNELGFDADSHELIFYGRCDLCKSEMS